MRLVRFVAVLLLAVSLPAGCGRKPRTRGHGAQEPSPTALAPTPDTPPGAALRSPAGLILLRDELAGWIAQVENAGRTRAFFLEAWDGDGEFSFDSLRRGTVQASGMCLSIFGGIQPGPLQAHVTAAGSGATDDGFLQRFQLLVWPDVSR